MPQALYFAPHFGKRVSKNYPGIHIGVSCIARIETVEVVEIWDDLLRTVKSIRGENWLTKNKDFLEAIRKSWNWPKKRSFLFLGKPRLVFNPPEKSRAISVAIHYDNKSNVVGEAYKNATIRSEGNLLIIEDARKHAELTEESILEIADENVKIILRDEDNRNVNIGLLIR